MVVRQGSLFDHGARVQPRLPGTNVPRTDLGQGAWIDVGRDWLAGADALFDRLVHTVPWRAERRPMYDRVVDVPRLMCFYDESERLPDPALERIREALVESYGKE